jgi:hypothetical protein
MSNGSSEYLIAHFWAVFAGECDIHLAPRMILIKWIRLVNEGKTVSKCCAGLDGRWVLALS